MGGPLPSPARACVCPSTGPHSLAVPQGHLLWSHPKLSQDTFQEMQVLGDTLCTLSLHPSLCLQPLPLRLLCFQKRGKKTSLQNIFREPLQVIPSPPPAGPACLITLHDSVLNSSQAPRHTTPPDIYMKGVVLDASHPISKI